VVDTKPKLPAIDSVEAREFCKAWDTGTHIDKLKLCRAYEVDYTQGGNYRSKCKVLEIPQESYSIPDYDWEEQLDRMIKMDELVAYHMQFPTEITIELKVNKPIAVPIFADLHLGAPGCDYQSVKDDVKLAKEIDGVYPLFGGDGYHNIIEASKVGSSMNQIPICVQKAVYYNILKYLEDKILAISTGNHNYWTALLSGEDWDAGLSRRLKVVYLKHYAVINLIVGEMVYKIVRMHKGRFSSSLNLTNTCKQNQRLYFPDARVVVVEHQHIAAIEEYRYNEHDCIAIRPGTYQTYDDYALMNGYFGSYVANPTIIFYPDKDKIIGFKDMRDGFDFLKAVR